MQEQECPFINRLPLANLSPGFLHSCLPEIILGNAHLHQTAEGSAERNPRANRRFGLFALRIRADVRLRPVRIYPRVSA